MVEIYYIEPCYTAILWDTVDMNENHDIFDFVFEISK